MSNLAATLGDLSDLAGARVLQEKVLELRRRVLGLSHPDTLASARILEQMRTALAEAPAQAEKGP